MPTQIPPTACLLALSPIEDDPRVRRQGEALKKAGWNVVAVGLPGGKSPSPDWPVLSVPQEIHAGVSAAPHDRSREVWREKSRALDLFRRPFEFLALRAFWTRAAMRKFYRHADGVRADLWVANDWPMLPVASRLARERGGIFVYDTHEFAVSEYEQSWKWRLSRLPLIKAIERHHIGSARVVSTVSDGIANALAAIYRLDEVPITIRNVPAFHNIEFRPTTGKIRVLYHGILVPGRGLETMIDSVVQWRSEFSLTLRGPGEESFIALLRKRIQDMALGNRVEIVPPVNMIDLVREASVFDVGIIAAPGHSKHNQFGLPNKFFEYTMAGLALCETDLPDTTRLMRQYDLGLTFDEVTPGSIARAVNTLNAPLIDRFKRNALAAARELCWEKESSRMVAIYEAAIGRGSPPAS